MRLTLRTLLAYLDDILEPAQTKEIGAKLNESSFASSLVSRIREVMRRRRLTAPTLTGPGVGVDPNAVAEYLDNTLAPDGIADVEKICLESDVHLAEVAACHQILTLALGEPVEISPPMRERMYALGPAGTRVTAGAFGVTTTSEELPSEAVEDVLAQAEPVGTRQPGMRVDRGIHESAAPPSLPEYLRPHTSWKRIFAYAAGLAVLVTWAVLVFNNSRVAKDSSETSHGGASRPAQHELVARNESSATESNAAAPEQSDEPSGAAADGGAKIAAQPDLIDGGEEEPAREVAATKPARSNRTIDLPEPPDAEDDEPPATAKTGQPTEADAAAATTGAAAAAKPAEGAATPAPPVPSGPPVKYVSREGIVLQYIPPDERWFMLRPNALIHPGEMLAVPEPFEGLFDIDDGRGRVTLLGRTSVNWLGLDPAVVGLELRRGQIVVRPSAGVDDAQPFRINLAIAGELWSLSLRPGTTVGVEVNPREPSKFEQDFEKNQSYSGMIAVSAGGAVDITAPGGKEIPLKGPARIDLPLEFDEASGKLVQAPLVTLPKWMGQPAMTAAKRALAQKFEKTFNLDEPVELSAPAVAADPNPGLSALATECLGLIDDTGELVNVLQRSPLEESRKAAISALRVWLPRSPENRKFLKAELAKRFSPEDADVAYRLLWGFDKDDARDKDKSMMLLEWMGHPELAIKELAWYQVSLLAGKKHEYRAGGTSLQLQSSLTQWRRHIQKEGALISPKKAAQ